MNLQERLSAFEKLGLFLSAAINGKEQQIVKKEFSNELHRLIDTIHLYNGWFTKTEVLRSLQEIVDLLKRDSLNNWILPYSELNKVLSEKNIGVIMAGNIPLVGFHDFMCVLISGNKIYARLSSDDNKLLPFIANVLCDIEPRFKNKIFFPENKLSNIDAVIATGSNNSARYFEYYFSKYPHIIRKNRNSVAVLTGTESTEQLKCLGKDVFFYYGLGCRNVSKLMIPEGYNFAPFFESIFDFSYVMDNKKYANNYEYNRTVYLMNSIKLFDNNFLLLKEELGLASPVGVLYYEYYKNDEALMNKLRADSPNIQCMVRAGKGDNFLSFGYTQRPSLNDYADGIDTIKFLIGLNIG